MRHFLIAFKAAGSKMITATIEAKDEKDAKKYFQDNFTGCKLLGIVELNI